MSASYPKYVLLYGFLALIILVISISPSNAKANISDWQRGASVQSTSPMQFASPAFKQSLINLKNDNANYVNLVIPIYQTNIHTSDIAPGSDTPTDETLIAAIKTAHSLGLKVSLKPHIETRDGQWRANIDPTDRTAWFAAYGEYVKHYATLAQANGAEQLIIGTELIDLSSNDYNSLNTSSWRTLIAQLRNIYSGSLTYAANWGTGSANEKSRITFWDDLDLVGIDAYYPLGSDYANNSVDQFRSYWASIDQNDIQPFQKKVNKPIIFTEIGYRSTTGAHIDPGNYQHVDGVNLTEQANAYEALLSYWNDKSYIKGIHLWNWDGNPNAGGIGDVDYTPQNKPAEQIMKKWFGLSGTVSFNVTNIPIVLPPSISVSTNISSGSIVLGDPVSISSTFSNMNGNMYSAIVDLEIYDLNGNKVFQKFYSNENLISSIPKGYTISWIPNTPGSYIVKVGVFNSDWSQNYIWQENSAQFIVSNDTSQITQSLDASVPTSQITTQLKQSTSIPVVITNSSTTSNVLVDLEIYNSQNEKISQKVFSEENFNPNQTKTYTISYIPQVLGLNTLKVGVFTNNWSRNFIWKENIEHIVVNDVAIGSTPSIVFIPQPLSQSITGSTTLLAQTSSSSQLIATTSMQSIASSSEITAPLLSVLACPTSVPIGSFSACFYDNKDLTNLKLVRTDDAINFDWGGGSPNSAIENGTYSAVWQGKFNFDSASYTFNINVDDGVRIYIDGALVLDKWMDQVANYQIIQAMTSGLHTIRVEYYQNQGGAKLNFTWSKGQSINSTPNSSQVLPVLSSSMNPVQLIPDIQSIPLITTLVSSSTPSILELSIDIWWPTNGVRVSGNLPLKVLIPNMDTSTYTMYWQVDGGDLVQMDTSMQDYPHKEAWVNVDSWNWKGTGPYTIHFIAKDLNGTKIAQQSTSITVTH